MNIINAIRAKTIAATKVLLMTIVALALVACSTRPPMPKKPNESKRIPINQTIPIELEG